MFFAQLAALGGMYLDESKSNGYQSWRLPKEPLVLAEILRFLNARSEVLYVEQLIPMVPSSLPDDPNFEDLWGLKNSGQSMSGINWDVPQVHSTGLIGSDIGIQEAWAQGLGDKEIVVAVTDTGVDITHSDLVDNIWVNQDEIPNNGIDDDANGYIDDIHGWDFCKNDNVAEDRNSHGTHVAGTIAASIGNKVGIVGVAPRAKIMALRVLPRCKTGDTSCDRRLDCPELFLQGKDIFMHALRYAADNGAKVVNASLGYKKEYLPVPKAASDTRTLEYLRSRGVLLVHSAGNAENNNDVVNALTWDDDLDNVIEVAASDRGDNLAYFSSYGSRLVHVAAPGVGILSAIPGNSYGWKDGTSMAAPHVAGAAALLLAKAPELSPSEIRSLLIETSDIVQSLRSRSLSQGRINLGAAVASLIPEWLLLKAREYTLLPGEEVEVTFDVTTQGLPAGDYESSLLVKVFGVSDQTAEVPVRITRGAFFASSASSSSPTIFLIPPAGLTVESDYYSTSIDLSWPERQDIDGYRLQRRLIGGDYEVIANPEQNNYSDATALADTNYEYRVASRLGEDVSDYSKAFIALRTEKSADIALLTDQALTESVVVGGSLAIVFSVANNGPEDVSSAGLSFTVPNSISLENPSLNSQSCIEFEGQFTCQTENLKYLDSVQFRASATLMGEADAVFSFFGSSALEDAPDISLKNNVLVYSIEAGRDFDLVLAEPEDSIRGVPFSDY